MTESKDRYNISSGSPWEPLRGYSRAVRVGDQLFVSGTTAVDDKGDVVSAGNHYGQTKYILQIIKKILARAGFKMSDVVRTKLFVTDMNKWEEYARAHREVFEKIRPASSIVQVTKLVDPRLLVEIEIDAILGSNLVESLSVKYGNGGE